MTMLPRLEAEGQLLSIEAARLGFGAYEQRDAAEKISRLHAKATGGEDVAPRAVKASPGQLGAIGLGVRQVPAKKALNDG